MIQGLEYLREINTASVLLRLTLAMFCQEAPAGGLSHLYAGVYGGGADHAAQSV